MNGGGAKTLSGVVKGFFLYVSSTQGEPFRKINERTFNTIFNERYVMPSEGPMILLYESLPKIAFYGPTLSWAENDTMAVMSAGGVNSTTFFSNSITGETIEYPVAYGIRPVLILDPNIKITGGNGNDSSTAYQLDLSKY